LEILGIWLLRDLMRPRQSQQQSGQMAASTVAPSNVATQSEAIARVSQEVTVTAQKGDHERASNKEVQKQPTSTTGGSNAVSGFDSKKHEPDIPGGSGHY
jgi:hypothetical protein